ncbi:MAG: T9SS type A sorting domain-containing protein [Flavobacteriales bacterium]|nr:T9SS type A sorting domain-containing protein [Flavobacteriales bacterium]
MKHLFTFSLIFSMLFVTKAKGQLSFFRNGNITVLETNGDTLKNPWAGGFNSTQFSEIDLDLDGTKDLISFDRTGNRLNTFINDGIANTTSYTHAPQYIQNFPKMTNWVLLRDYNCDGKMDIFTAFSGGIRIYKNTSAGTLNFTLVDSILSSNYQPDSTPNFIPLYVSSSDLPAIDDIDGDGDLDILTFSAAGSYVEYHKNLTIENNGNCDSLSFELRNRCWGFFKENSSNNSVTFNDTCNFNNNNPEKGAQHAGSTLFTMDVDANNSKELILGDAAFNNLTLLYNSDFSPNLDGSNITSQDTAFPSNHSGTFPVDLYVFPAGFYFDVNNDNVDDLIVATNFGGTCKNNENIWLYENNNATNNPNFNLSTNSFLQEGMIEQGEGAYPTFFDYNADGLLDIVIGNYGVFDTSSSTNFNTSLWLYENVGTLLTPIFQLIDMDYANISTMNLDLIGSQPGVRLTPTFGDVDGDGDEDMLVGGYWGYIHYFENTAGAGNTANFVLNQVQYQGIDVGLFSSPQLVDLNRDLLLDLVIGKRDGYFSYYENIGTSSSPNFSLITSTLGNVHTKRYNEFNGNSMPFVYDDAGVYKMLSGATNGYIYQFGNIDGNLTGTFSIDSSFQNIQDGSSTSVTLADINNDSFLDLLIGNYSGGVVYYQGDFPTTTILKDNNVIDEIKVYPNPAQNYINIDFGKHLTNSSIEILDILGKRVYSEKVESQQIIVNIQNLSLGVYFLKINTILGATIHKIIKN